MSQVRAQLHCLAFGLSLLGTPTIFKILASLLTFGLANSSGSNASSRPFTAGQKVGGSWEGGSSWAMPHTRLARPCRGGIQQYQTHT